MFRGDFSFDKVLDDPAGALLWAEKAWDEVQLVQSCQSNYDLYHCRDKDFEATVEEFQPRAVFPLPKLLVDKISIQSTMPYLSPGSFVGVPLDANLFPGFGLDQNEINHTAMAAGTLIEQHLRDWANVATNFPLWSKNASLGGSAMITSTWKTETRKIPVPNGTPKRRTVQLADGTKKSILFPEMKEQIIRESMDMQALPPGTWGVDPECRDMNDMVWGWSDEYLPAAQVIAHARSGYFDLISPTELEGRIGGRGRGGGRYDEQKIYFMKHLFEHDQFKKYFGQAPSEPIDRVCLRTFYTKEIRIYAVNRVILRVEANPYSLLSDGYPFEILTCNGTGNIMGTSDLYYLRPYFFEYNKLRNAELYNAELASDQAWITTERNLQTVEDFKYRQAGSVIYSNLGPTSFVPIPFNPISPEVRATRIGIMQDLFLLSGLDEVSLGQAPPANIRSQKQMASLLQQQASRMDAGNLIVGTAMRSLARKWLSMYRSFLSTDQVVKLYGAETTNQFSQLSPDHFGAVHDLELRSAFEEEAKKGGHMQDMITLLPIVAQIPGFNVKTLAQDLFRQMGLNPDKYDDPGAPPAIPPNGSNQPNPQNANPQGQQPPMHMNPGQFQNMSMN